MLRGLSKHLIKITPVMSRGVYTIIPKASDIIAHGKTKSREAMGNNLEVTEKTNCYECYKLMNEHHINYLRVMKDNCVIGILKKSDVKELMLFHQFEQEEDDTILEEFRKNGQ